MCHVCRTVSRLSFRVGCRVAPVAVRAFVDFWSIGSYCRAGLLGARGTGPPACERAESAHCHQAPPRCARPAPSLIFTRFKPSNRSASVEIFGAASRESGSTLGDAPAMRSSAQRTSPKSGPPTLYACAHGSPAPWGTPRGRPWGGPHMPRAWPVCGHLIFKKKKTQMGH